MVKKKSNKFGYTRQYHISLSYQQIELYEKAIKTQNELYQFALKYLYKTYGRKHIGRPLPFGQGINYLNNKIKAMFINEKYELKRWNVKKLGLSSHAADEFLKIIFTNFSQYRKRLEQAGQMSAVEKYNLRMNITKDKDGKHKNPKHRSWYRKGSMNFLRNNNSFRTITSQKLPKGNTKLVSPHHLNVAVWFTWHEGLPDLLTFFSAGRDVLQVRIHTRKSTSCSQSLQVTCVHAAIWLDNIKQTLYIGRLNLGNLTVIQNFTNNWTLCL